VQAVELDDTHANNLCNYGLFLSEEKSKFAEAEGYYQQVLMHTPDHANTLYNYAVMLDSKFFDRKRRAEAETYVRLPCVCVYIYMLQHSNTNLQYPQHPPAFHPTLFIYIYIYRYYRRAVDVEPRHAFALYNLAVLLEDQTAQVELEESRASGNAGGGARWVQRA